MKTPLAALLSFLAGALLTFALPRPPAQSAPGNDAEPGVTSETTPRSLQRRIATLEQEIARNREKVRQAELVLYRDRIAKEKRRSPDAALLDHCCRMLANAGVPVEQDQRIRDALARYAETDLARRRAKFRGEPDPAPEAKGLVESLSGLLTPAQLEALVQYRAKQRQLQIESTVQQNMENNLQLFPLDLDQQEQLRALYQNVAAKNTVEDGIFFRVAIPARTIAEDMHQLLSPTQYEIWSARLAQ